MKLTEFSRTKWERARDLKKRGQYQEAERELKEALEDAPDHFLLKASLADVYLRQDRSMEAKILVESILSFDPQYPQARYILGEIFFKQNLFEQALQCFRQVSQKDPRPYLILRVARTLSKMERYEEALETLDSALVSERKNPGLLKEKALTLVRMNRSDEALDLYEKLHELNPDDSFVRKEIYRLKGKNRPDEKIIHELQTVVKLSSGKDDAQLHGFLGQKLKGAGKLEEAAAEFRLAQRLDTNNVFFLKQEGFCHYQSKDYAKAIQTLGDSFRKDPGDYIVKKTLEKIYTTIHNLEGFKLLLEEILKDHPHNVKLMGTLKKIQKQVNERKP
jgi:tetratricopeptide (TPR) repeat protein